jgi:hypothetical protein
MKKAFFIVRICLLLAFFYSQASMNVSASHVLATIDYMVDPTVQVDENCEENSFTHSGRKVWQPKRGEYPACEVSPYTLLGIKPCIWQPPE